MRLADLIGRYIDSVFRRRVRALISLATAPRVALRDEALRATIPNKVCLIAATARSGSNYLGSLMASTGTLGYPGEYLSISATSADLGAEFCPEQRIPYMVRRGTSPNHVLTVKLFPEHVTNLDLATFFTSPMWVWLRRHDILGQAISSVIATQTDAWSSHQRRKAEPKYDPDLIRKHLLNIMVANSAWELYFASNGVSAIHLWYEDVVAHPHKCVSAIAKALKVPMPDAVSSHGDFTVQRGAEAAEWRARFIAEYGDASAVWPPLRVAKRTRFAVSSVRLG
jgi:trehalose 2-sulfotransferase